MCGERDVTQLCVPRDEPPRDGEPIAWRHGDALIEGVIDLAFEEGPRWTLVDFKTDETFRSVAPYQRQVGLYDR
jgi:ATP-dependent exoDNAse (exonuclease V) beta subunit